jgi:2-dehydro-3-deoxy-D-arabinonate dehydratase
MKLAQVIYQSEKFILINDNDSITLSFSDKARSTLDLINNYQGNTLSDKIFSYQKEAQIKLETNESQLEVLKDFKWLTCIDAPEVWAVGVTYKRQAKEHDDDIKVTTNKTDELYTFVYENERAEVFFKGFNRTIKAHGESLLLRGDSELVLPEAESVLVLGDGGQLLGFTYGNDLTAWDLEKECPLYLNQAKIWDGSAGVGQYIIPYEQIKDPYDFKLICTVHRDGKEVINSVGNTQGLKRSYEELIYYLRLNNSVPSGTLLFTGTACIIPHDFSLRDGDTVTVEKEGYGKMVNSVEKLKVPNKNFKVRL